MAAPISPTALPPPAPTRTALRSKPWPNIAIVSAYNDMLSAHQPYERYPPLIRAAARDAGAIAQFAGGVPAMCDGVTQGTDSMELSLFSRDVIAMSTAIALSHNMFDAALLLGICDKIVPGLFIGAMAFGHLPVIFVPSGPMASGMSNPEKSRIRNLYAQGKATRDELLAAESASYHDVGTCTFYGTANSNQMLMEIMGLHLPGAAFVPPKRPLRDALTIAATQRAAKLSDSAGGSYMPVSQVIDERSFVNAIVGLLATGGSTNHTIHLVAMAHAAGITINWDDFNELSAVVPLLARIYPNGKADMNHFQAAGGMGFLIRELLSAGLLHEDVRDRCGQGAQRLLPGTGARRRLAWSGRTRRPKAAMPTVLRSASAPFSADGGLRLLRGNLGRSVIKVSAVAPEHQVVRGPCHGVYRSGAGDRSLPRGQADPRCGGGGARTGTASQWHAGTAQTHPHAVGIAVAGPPCGAGHRWPHVGRIGHGASCHSCFTGESLRRATGPGARWRCHPPGCTRRHARSAGAMPRNLPHGSQPRPRTPPATGGSGRELFASFRVHATDAESGARTCNP